MIFGASVVLKLCSAYQGKVEEAYRYSRLSLKLLEEHGAEEWLARVYGFAYGMVYPLKHPFRDTVEPLRVAHRKSLVLGDIHVSCVMMPDQSIYSCFLKRF